VVGFVFNGRLRNPMSAVCGGAPLSCRISGSFFTFIGSYLPGLILLFIDTAPGRKDAFAVTINLY
jgi:hypothetical protein